MKYLFTTLALGLLFFSCSDDPSNVYQANQIHTIPYGGTGILASGNYSGQGTVTNVAGTTVNVEGVVYVDAITMSGKVNVPFGSTLIVNDLTNVGGGANLVVKGTIRTKTFTQVGKTCVNFGAIKATGRFTIGGGTTLYLTKSEIEADEMVITGHIEATTNNATKDWFSMIDLKGGSKYLNRGGGTNICGPLLFNSDDDQGASGVSLDDVTSTALSQEVDVRATFGLSDTSKLYQYSDNCTPLAFSDCN